jgi:hypothetical protein
VWAEETRTLAAELVRPPPESGGSGNGLLARAIIASAVTQIGVWSLVRE